MSDLTLHGDAVQACADLVGRCGATGFEIGYLHDDVPSEQADWYEWTALCVATVRLGRALADFDEARRRYVAAHPPPPGGWPRTGRRAHR